MDISKPSTDPEPSPTRRKGGWAAKLAILVLIIVLAGIAGLGAVLFAPPFDGLRRDLAERLLEYRLGRDIHVTGELKVSVGRNVAIDFSDVVVKNPDWASKPDMARIETGEIELRLWPLILGDLVVPHLVVDGGELNFEVAADGKRSWRDGVGDNAGDDGIDGLPLLGSVSIKNLALDWLDKSNGFDIDLKLDGLETERAKEDGANRIGGSGTLNGTKFTVTGQLPALERESSSQSHAVQLTLETTGFDVSLDGEIDEPLDGAGVDVALKAKVASLGDLLDTLEIARALEGEGDVAGRLTGDFDALKLSDLQIDVKTQAGDTGKLTGSIEDLADGSGIDLRFRSKLAPERVAAGSESIFDGYRLVALSGQVTGDLDELQVTGMHVRTNAYAREFKRIGPISIARFRKDAQNRLQLLGINAIAGPTGSPVFQLRGSIGDLLGLTQLSLFGSFDIDTAPVLGFDAEDLRTKLGKLSGSFQLSDADGSAGLEKLDAEVTGTSLLSLKIASAFDDFAQGDGLKLDVSLRVPDYAALAQTLGETPVKIGAVEFNGELSGSDERVDLKGKALIGKTSVTGNLTGTLKGKRPFLQGSLSSPDLRWLDLRALALAGGGAAKSSSASAKPGAGEPAAEAVGEAVSFDRVDLDLQVKVGKISGGGNVSNITSHAKLTDGVLTLAPLHMNYLGGAIKIDGTFDGRKRPSRLKFKGTVDDWQIGRVLKELGAEAPVSGEMYASFDLSASGDTNDALWRSLTGRFDTAISRGRIESAVVALTGLDISAYLFSDAAKKGYTEVNCFIGRFALKNGVATATTLLLDTPDIQMVGEGSINLRNDTIDIHVQPHPKRHKLIELGTPFTITGPLSDPKYTAKGTGLRVVGETVLLGQNLLGTLVNLITDGGKDVGNPCLGTRAR